MSDYRRRVSHWAGSATELPGLVDAGLVDDVMSEFRPDSSGGHGSIERDGSVVLSDEPRSTEGSPVQPRQAMDRL